MMHFVDHSGEPVKVDEYGQFDEEAAEVEADEERREEYRDAYEQYVYESEMGPD